MSATTNTTTISFGYYNGAICFLSTTDKELSKSIQRFESTDKEFSTLNLDFKNPNGGNLVKQEEQKRQNSQHYNSLFVDKSWLVGDVFTFQYDQEFMNFLNEKTNNFENFEKDEDDHGGFFSFI